MEAQRRETADALRDPRGGGFRTVAGIGDPRGHAARHQRAHPAPIGDDDRLSGGHRLGEDAGGALTVRHAIVGQQEHVAARKNPGIVLLGKRTRQRLHGLLVGETGEVGQRAGIEQLVRHLNDEADVAEAERGGDQRAHLGEPLFRPRAAQQSDSRRVGRGGRSIDGEAIVDERHRCVVDGSAQEIGDLAGQTRSGGAEHETRAPARRRRDARRDIAGRPLQLDALALALVRTVTIPAIAVEEEDDVGLGLGGTLAHPAREGPRLALRRHRHEHHVSRPCRRVEVRVQHGDEVVRPRVEAQVGAEHGIVKDRAGLGKGGTHRRLGALVNEQDQLELAGRGLRDEAERLVEPMTGPAGEAVMNGDEPAAHGAHGSRGTRHNAGVRIRIGSRGSALALWQAEHVKAQLVGLGHDVSITVITTTGDRVLDRRLENVGGKGAFLKEIEEAMVAGEIDLAVHSLKDVPTSLPPGLGLCAFLPRVDPRDAFISGDGRPLAQLPQGARVGTTSLRRQAQLRAMRSDLQILDLRGNVDTRLRRLHEGAFDAILLAMAGVTRLGRAAEVTEAIPPEVILPAPGQGTIALECREADADVVAAVAPLNHEPSQRATTAERTFLAALGGGCNVPLGAYAEADGDALWLRALVAREDGSLVLTGERRGSDAIALGYGLAGELLAKGAGPLVHG